LGPKSKITKEDIKLKLFEIEQKNLSSCFSATSRESRDYAFRNKTQGPSVGQYHPQMSSIDKNTNPIQ
jgi:hypothetical protein